MEKSGNVIPGVNAENYSTEKTNAIYGSFDINNFREQRVKNKTTLQKEFSSDRIKTQFIDLTLFKSEDVKICGYLDSFYEAPLLFANPSDDIFAEGTDILFNTIIKFFELNKNIQMILCIKDGLKNNYIKQCVDFLSQNSALNGRWVFIDGEIHLPKFLAGSNMYLAPSRLNSICAKHLLAMHYGCVPVVSKTGYLNDTVTDIFESVTKGNGFKTSVSLMTEDSNSEIYYKTLSKAVDVYKNNHSSWHHIVKNSMNSNFNWDFKKLERYNKVYQEIL